MVDTVAINNKFALDMKMGPVFQTTVIPLMGGYEDRNQDWQVALWRYDVSLNNRPLAEIRSFMAHVLGRRGSANAFPLRDPLDNTLTDENIGTGDGTTTEFQIAKTYADADRPYRRPLAIVSNLVVKVAGVTQVETVDFNTEDGWIAFTSAPTAGQAVTVTCDFLIPVRYEADQNLLTLPIGPGTSNAFASAGPFTLVEQHVPKPELLPPPSVLAISGTPILIAVKDFAYDDFTVSAVGGVLPYTFTVHSGSLPAGISLDSSTGVVSGSPTTLGTSSGIVIRVTDDIGGTDDLASFSIEVVVAADPHFANVVLLLDFEGSDGATSTTDESPSAHSVAFNGNAQIDTALAKFGSSSCLFDGTGDYLSIADSTDWDLSDANSDLYTIEFFFYPVVTGSNMRVIGQAPSTSNVGFYFTYSSSKMGFRHSFDGTVGNSVLVGNSNNLNLNAWNYIAVTKNSAGKIRQWVNGALDGSATPATSSMFNSTGALEIGRAFGATGNLNGSLDEIRITKGACRYDTDGSIPVPTAAFPRG
ncbi:hypothetical protein GCM10010869_01080 [Mesorhizobium tianshanense]|uniref:Uncharacterized protein (TIGR02217 family) n=1 Tax=Mesorhizobium tianshanense TaxID=39844 RepID=A0A562NPG0_9HYPH|nr:DUF2460 domain-containing protein [Mesorhizobium tianshanense]TWI34058.1 uncharacterized protein (TIGR02217 family) [Mesorhizobium tianshanense]GLS34520.1 hypothetical protein GCM10010869_01080 [Mesorhizobium tianshanense]